MTANQYTAHGRHVHRPNCPPIESEIGRRGMQLRRAGRELIGSCPVCGGTDRFGVNIAKQIWNCRGCGRGGDVIDLVQHVDGVGFAAAIAELTGKSSTPAFASSTPVNTGTIVPVFPHVPSSGTDDYDRGQHAKAAWLWRQRQPIGGSIAETYLREVRGIPAPLPPALAFLPARTPSQHPAMIAAFRAESESSVAAVHLTLLKPDGSGKADVAKPKIFVGRPLAQPIVLAPIGDMLALAITEGIEDGLSVRAALDLGVWAAGSGNRMPEIASTIPGYVETVTIWAHADAAGQDGARKLDALLHARGIEVFIDGLDNAG
jgi:putative DNA primase/helicase